MYDNDVNARKVNVELFTLKGEIGKIKKGFKYELFPKNQWIPELNILKIVSTLKKKDISKYIDWSEYIAIVEMLHNPQFIFVENINV